MQLLNNNKIMNNSVPEENKKDKLVLKKYKKKFYRLAIHMRRSNIFFNITTSKGNTLQQFSCANFDVHNSLKRKPISRYDVAHAFGLKIRATTKIKTILPYFTNRMRGYKRIFRAFYNAKLGIKFKKKRMLITKHKPHNGCPKKKKKRKSRGRKLRKRRLKRRIFKNKRKKKHKKVRVGLTKKLNFFLKKKQKKTAFLKKIWFNTYGLVFFHLDRGLKSTIRKNQKNFRIMLKSSCKILFILFNTAFSNYLKCKENFFFLSEEEEEITNNNTSKIKQKILKLKKTKKLNFFKKINKLQKIIQPYKIQRKIRLLSMKYFTRNRWHDYKNKKRFFPKNFFTHHKPSTKKNQIEKKIRPHTIIVKKPSKYVKDPFITMVQNYFSRKGYSDPAMRRLKKPEQVNLFNNKMKTKHTSKKNILNFKFLKPYKGKWLSGLKYLF